MESEDDFDMHDANDDEDDDNDDHFYSGGDDDGAVALDSDDADIADYEFIDNDSDDSDDVISNRYQVGDCLFRFNFTKIEKKKKKVDAFVVDDVCGFNFGFG